MAIIGAMRSPVATPVVRIAFSALAPQVISPTVPGASSIDAAVWVAPNSLALLGASKRTDRRR